MVYHCASDAGRATSQQYTNVVPVLFQQGKIAEAEQVSKTASQRFANSVFAYTSPLSFLWERQQLDSMELLYRSMSTHSSPIIKVNGIGGLANMALLRGRMADAQNYGAQARQIQRSLGQPPNPLLDSLQLSNLELGFYDDTVRAVRRMDAVLSRTDLAAIPFDQRPYVALAGFYAGVGQPAM